MNIHGFYERVFRLFRPRRLREFYRTFGVSEETRILDLGGTDYWWRLAGELGLPMPKVTVLNLDPPPARSLPAGLGWVRGNGCLLPFADHSFDIAISNSVIEHLYTSGNQRLFASEIRRVARRWWVETPDFRCPIEPHYLAFGVHWLPVGLRGRVVRWCTPWGWMAHPALDHCRRMAREIRILRRSEMQQLFPDSRILVERVLGLPKSLIAVRS